MLFCIRKKLFAKMFREKFSLTIEPNDFFCDYTGESFQQAKPKGFLR